ncbi:MAG: asparaginase, partial [Lachnospiraceae bacterium]|nr:asparaginase [Lachnospiraceae bacterium]
MRKILVVLTGGTIGSRVEGRQIDVTDESPYYLLDLYKKTYGSVSTFEVIHPFNLLSENMNLHYFSQLARVMWELPYRDCAGVIVAHGSDTLSYS